MEWKNSLKSKKKLGSAKPVVNYFPVIMVSVSIVTWKRLEIKDRNTDGMKLKTRSNNSKDVPGPVMFVK